MSRSASSPSPSTAPRRVPGPAAPAGAGRSAGSTAPGGPRRLTGTSAFALVTAVIGLALFASATPSPLYEVYREDWGFSSLALTVAFGIYPVGVLVSLLTIGSVSDHVGRRPVLVAALSVLVVTSLYFMVLPAYEWLLVARGVQGLATGAALGAASAAMLDFEPSGDAKRVGLANGLASMVGLAGGAFLASILVAYLPAPRVLPFVLVTVLFAVALFLARRMPEPVAVAAKHERPPFRLERPGVPREVRGPFLVAALAVMSSWSIGGLVLSLGPELAAGVLDTSSPVAGGAANLALNGGGALSILLLHRVIPWRGAVGGSLTLATGLVLLLLAVEAGTAVGFFAAATLTGAGFGVAFLGGLRTLTAAIPAHHRARVMSAFYLVAYASLSVPAVLAGALVPTLGLEQTFDVFGGIAVVVALLVAAAAWRTRPGGAADPAAVLAAVTGDEAPTPGPEIPEPLVRLRETV